MLPCMEADVPAFLTQRNEVAYCRQLHVKKTKSTLVLSRNLRFYEFQQKELVHHIDLRSTCLQKLTTELQAYSGPVSSFLIRDDVADTSGDSTSYSMLHAAEELPLSLGKYIWLGEYIYVLLKCWHTLLVLQRPSEHGASFQLIAEHENVEEYRLVRGPIEYQAYVELLFVNGKRQRTNFQTAGDKEASTVPPSTCSAAGFERLMQRVHGAQAELLTQRALTQQDFVRAREQNAFGVPGQRSLLLEEKQLLRRCGDVWTRICGNYLVLGTLLSNSAGSNRPTTLHELRPLIHLPQGNGLNFTHRLYELPLQADGEPPEDYDALAQFWACQQQHSTNISWRLATAEAQLPPERSAVLLVRLQLEDLLPLEKFDLLAIYELQDTTTQGNNSGQLQLQLASFNVANLLEQPELHAPRFTARTMHQDFLAVIMTQTSHCPLRLQFQSATEQQQFEQLLETKLGLKSTTLQPMATQPAVNELLDEDFAFNDNHKVNSQSTMKQRIFYNPQSHLLLLHNDPDQHWHIYASSETELCLLLRRLQRDLLQLHCNVSLLELDKDACSVPRNAAILLESALREELQAKAELLQLQPQQDQLKAESLERVHELEMATDLLYSVIKSQHQLESG